MIFSKKYFSPILGLLILASCTGPLLIHENSVRIKPDQMMLNYYSDFEIATESHDSDKIMILLHPDYVREQHDEFLEGRTDQFINEFFGCRLTEIKRVDYIVTYQWLGSQWADFWIIQKDGSRHRANWTILDRRDDSGYSIGFLGAVG